MKRLIKKILPPFIIDLYHLSLALLAAFLYRFPSLQIKVIGVTGTDGKTTTVNLITQFLEEAGYKTASLSSIKFKIGKEEWPNVLRMTMPGRFQIQKFLRQAVKTDCQYAVLEVSSEGIKQFRHRFIKFEVAVFTNLTKEHIESHGGFDNYRWTKGSFFQAVKKIHVLNLDDDNADYFLSFIAERKYGYRIKSEKINDFKERVSYLVEASDCQISSEGIKFLVENTEFKSRLLGEYNVYNSLAAICVSLSQNIDLETAQKALEKVSGVPGRMEEISSRPFRVFVDYAVTPNALEKTYKTIKDSFKPNQLICVLGACGGGRDKWKRPVLGEIANNYCDKIVITNEDPYDENPLEIIEQLAEGAKGKAEKILDRREAIRRALSSAGAADVVVITGKGCESSMCIDGGKKIPWDDRKIVREELKKLGYV